MESRGHGVLDIPHARGMTAACGAPLENQIMEIDCAPTRNALILTGMTLDFQRLTPLVQTIAGTPMARVRCITEIGMAVDVHARDATKPPSPARPHPIRHSPP